jgi:ribosome-associated protein
MSKETANTKQSAAAPEADNPPAPPTRFEDLDERLKLALHSAAEKKALQPVVLDLRAIANFTDFFLITSGANTRQVQAIADEVVEQLKRQGGVRAARVEGRQAAEWVLLDYGDFIVHVFESKARQFYDLERLWRDAARVALPDEIAGGGGAPSTEKL